MKNSPAGPGEQRGGVRRAARRMAPVTLGVAAVLYAMLSGCSKPADVKSLATGPMAKLTLPETAAPQPTTSFTGPDGKAMTLADLKGKVAVVNLWATWCAPCKAEMPSLAALQKAYAGQPVIVVPVSVDTPEKAAEAKAFLAGHGGLPFYNDAHFSLPFAFVPQASGIPTTVIYDRDGKERARLSGGADWSTDQAKKVVDAVLAMKG
jgi:thiol-disulfide isomerase/thioredoxin